MHAILGASEHCIATHPSDMCVALAALDADGARDGRRAASGSIAFADFHRLPGDTPQIDTKLEPGELITAVDLPAEGFAQHYTYLKLRDRLSYAFALVSVAAALELDEGAHRRARGSRWAASRTSRGATARPSACCVGEAPASRGVRARRRSHAAPAPKATAHNDFKIELAPPRHRARAASRRRPARRSRRPTSASR